MKLLKTIFLILFTGLVTNTAYAATVDNINVLNSHEIEMKLSDDVTLWESVSGEIKVLKDILVTYAVRDANDHNKVILTLQKDLDILTNYNLLTIYGGQGNIDFKTDKTLDDVELMNAFEPESQGIVKVVTQWSRALEVYFKHPVEDDDFEFKLFSEIFVDSLEHAGENTITLHLEKAIEANSSYMLMILSLKNGLINTISFTEDLYDFSTGNTIEVVEKEETVKIDDNGEVVLELENVALNAAETPDTGAETWVLVALTLLVNAGLFMRKKLQK